MTALTPSIIDKLRQITGSEGISTTEEDRYTHSYDAKGAGALPEAVVWPTTTEEVAAIMALADERRFVVVPRGAGSGLTGGSVPMAGGLVISLTRMDRVIEINSGDLTATVQPGVINARFQKMVEERGLFFPPDPGSSQFSTLGGNVAENAGGLRAVKYGVTRDYVLGLTAVIPGGDILRCGVRTKKGVVGYDLTRLIVGSEGTLAVITELIFRLIPKPESVRTVTAWFDHPARASMAVARIMSAGVLPSTLEFMDYASLTAVNRFLNLGLPGWVRALLLIELDGPPEVVDRHVKSVEAVLRDCRAGEVHTAADLDDADRLWRARRAIGAAIFRLAPGKINEDVVVPISRVPDMIERLEALSDETGLPIVTFGHLGDGNLHVNVMYYPEKGKQERDKALRVVERVFEHTLDLGGTLSGEHGVGTAKRDYIGLEVDRVGLRLMREVKRVFDPHNILNPDKILPDDHAG